ncbi:hypothetical protein NUACC21_26620 [Scytonema sp. NUACC21]
MIDPSGIKPLDELIVKEVKPGVHIIENAYEGVYDHFAEHSMAINSSDTSSQSGSDWDALDELQESVKKETSNPGAVAPKVNQTNQPREVKQ